MQITNPEDNFILKGVVKTSTGDPLVNLAPILGISSEPVKLGKVAAKKVIREAIVAVPFYDYTPSGKTVEDRRKFFELDS